MTKKTNYRTRPCDNPFNAQRIDSLDYIEFDHTLPEIADRLQQRSYRGAICGPHGSGKTAMLQALGDELMHRGLSPLPLFINSDQRGQLPADWARAIRRAKPTDVLLLDGYDLLPAWARAWALFASRKAGGVVVTTHHTVFLETVARPQTSPVLLNQLVHQLAPNIDGELKFDIDALYRKASGNLRDALRMAYDLYASAGPYTSETNQNRIAAPAESRKAGLPRLSA